MSGMGKVKAALEDNLRVLHLPTIRECFDESARRAEKETLSYEQYLLELTQKECEQRRQKRLAPRVNAAL